MDKTVLITGSNGFVGSHIVDALLRHGYRVRAMVRATSDLRWLEEKPVETVIGTLQDADSLRAAVDGVDMVVHNAGIVSAPDPYHYYLHNTEGTTRLLEAALEAAPKLERFLFVSSQAAGGPTGEGGARREEDEPYPITDYGRSKLLAETSLRRYMDKLPITIVRPPSVYGPRDEAFLPLFKLIDRGLLPRIGGGQELSLVHAQDLARQVLAQLERDAAVGEVFHAAPFPPVTDEQFGLTIARVVSSHPRQVPLPGALLKYSYPVVYPLLKLVGVDPPFRPDKLPDVLAHRWVVSGEKAAKLLGFEGKLPLQAGLSQTAEWYRWKEWLTTRRDRMKVKGRARVESRAIGGRVRDYDPSCDLCGLVFEGEVKTPKHYEDEDFVIVDCMICRVPMAVLKEHRAAFTDEEKRRLIGIFRDLFGGDHTPDFEQRRIPDHAHVHYRNTGHPAPWIRRPEEADEA